MTTICADCEQLLPNERSFGATVNNYLEKFFPQEIEGNRDNTISVTAAPAKLENILVEIIELFDKVNTNNWDNDGAKAIPNIALRDAVNFIVMLPPGIPLPEVCPASNGAVDFEWDFDDSRCNVEIFGNGSIVYAGYLAEDDREYGTKPFKTAIPKTLINLLDRMEKNQMCTSW